MTVHFLYFTCLLVALANSISIIRSWTPSTLTERHFRRMLTDIATRTPCSSSSSRGLWPNDNNSVNKFVACSEISAGILSMLKSLWERVSGPWYSVFFASTRPSSLLERSDWEIFSLCASLASSSSIYTAVVSFPLSLSLQLNSEIGGNALCRWSWVLRNFFKTKNVFCSRFPGLSTHGFRKGLFDRFHYRFKISGTT